VLFCRPRRELAYAPGQNLIVDVLNIDLAGHFEPWRGNFSNLRIMCDVTAPSFKLRYVLSEKGKRTRSGEDNLTDINYQMNPLLLDDWFRRVVGRDNAAMR
jgi:Protein of unknown function (DUF3016)